MFKHYLLTRFNLKISDLSTIDKNGVEAHSEQWLTERFSLFEKYTLPSVINQSSYNFKWIVMFDKDTPEVFKARIASYSSKFEVFEPVYIEAYSDWKKYLSDYLKADNNKEYVITSRVDNDDIIHTDYIKNTQLLFQPQDDIFISFYKSGVQYGIQNRRFRSLNFVENHFTSRIEKAENLQTVLNFNHMTITKLKKPLIKCEEYERMWIELIHSSNVVNSEQNKNKIIFLDNTEKDYGVKLEYEKLGAPKRIYFYLMFLLNKVIRTPIKYLKRVLSTF